jgi:hypothetical protein
MHGCLHLTLTTGTGKGVSVREFVEGCKRVTGADIKVKEQAKARPGDYAEVGPTTILARHIVYCMMHRSSTLHPPHGVPMRANSSTTLYTGPRHIIHRIVYQ